MKMQEIAQHAHALYRAHGDRAEAEAAQKASAEAAVGNSGQAEDWEKIRRQIKELRGPRAT